MENMTSTTEIKMEEKHRRYLNSRYDHARAHNAARQICILENELGCEHVEIAWDAEDRENQLEARLNYLESEWVKSAVFIDDVPVITENVENVVITSVHRSHLDAMYSSSAHTVGRRIGLLEGKLNQNHIDISSDDPVKENELLNKRLNYLETLWASCYEKAKQKE